jgi:hypothetical protein
MLDTLTFFSLSIIFLLLGLRFLKNKNIKFFLFLMVLFPFASALASFHTRYQINVYYIFVFVIILMHILNDFLKNRVAKTVLYVGLFLSCFIFFYLMIDVLLNPKNLNIIDLLKDFKPLLFLFFGFILLDIFRNNQIDWGSSIVKKILFYNFIASIFWFVIFNNTGFVSFVTNDGYYQINETRYSSLGSSFVILYFIANLSINKKINKKELLYIFFPLFLAGNRTIFFALAVVYLVNVLLSTKDVLKLTKKFFAFGLGLSIIILGIFSFNEKLQNRILSMFDYDLVIKQLFSNRFSPFFEKLLTFKWYNYFFGKGIGETIYIPWFVYRENINNFNSTMDNIYMTLYIKYGIFSLLLLSLVALFFFKLQSNKRFKYLLCIYYLIMGLTTAFIYQTKFLFELVILSAFVFKSIDSPLVNKTSSS